jgi:hypothetical protein
MLLERQYGYMGKMIRMLVEAKGNRIKHKTGK